jgi:O-antigen/teichoic acid export membrane protein
MLACNMAGLGADVSSMRRRLMSFGSTVHGTQPPGEGVSRSHRRYRAILLGGGFAGLAKLVGFASVAISVPLTVRYLGPERYGMWMTISSLFAVLSFADFGIGLGLVSAIARSDGSDDRSAAIRLVSSAFFMLSGIAVLVLGAFLLAYPFVPWAKVFAVTGDDAAYEAGPCILVFMILFTVGLPFTIVQRIQMGLQESWLSNLWLSFGSLLALFGVLTAALLHAGVVWLVAAMSGGPVIATVANSVVEFTSRRPDLRPKFQNYSFRVLKTLLASSVIFVALQFLSIVSTATDSMIIAHVCGVSAVGPYAVTYKLFQTSLVFGLFVFPLWPAIGEALARGDLGWARLALKRATLVSVCVGAAFALGLLLFGQALVRMWAGPTLVPDTMLVRAFSIWVILGAFGGAMTTLLNNAQFLRRQLAISAAAALTSIGLKIPLAYWLGPSGVVWATVIGYSVLYCLPAWIVADRALRVSGTDFISE